MANSSEDKLAMLDLWQLAEGTIQSSRQRSGLIHVKTSQGEDVPVRIVQLQPGEMLIVPAFWWAASAHGVVYDGASEGRIMAPSMSTWLQWDIDGHSVAKFLHGVLRDNTWRVARPIR